MTTTINYSEKIQELMDDVYNKWNAGERKSQQKILSEFSETHRIAVVFGNFNYQVENGGIEQYIYNGYFMDNKDTFADFLNCGKEIDERFAKIYDIICQLDRECSNGDYSREGYYVDHCGDCGSEEEYSLGDCIDSEAFDSWYYENCGGDDWWEAVYRIIEAREHT